MSFRLPGPLGLFAILALGSCRTTFVGSAQFPDGPQGCWTRCKAQGMDMSTFVYVGDYSTACACKPRVAGGATSSKADADAAEGAVVAAAAGVEVQRQQAEDAAGNQNQLTPGAPPRY